MWLVPFSTRCATLTLWCEGHGSGRGDSCSIRFSIVLLEADISGDSDLFDGERAIGRAHVDIRVPRASAGERRKAERLSTARRMGPFGFKARHRSLSLT